jgi:hypothetical protein
MGRRRRARRRTVEQRDLEARERAERDGESRVAVPLEEDGCLPAHVSTLRLHAGKLHGPSEPFARAEDHSRERASFAAATDVHAGDATYRRTGNRRRRCTMFFTTLIAAPILAGLVAGVWRARRIVAWTLAGTCVALGVAGAIAMAFNPDDRANNITFGLVAGVFCAGLVWIGDGLGRVGRRATT